MVFVAVDIAISDLVESTGEGFGESGFIGVDVLEPLFDGFFDSDLVSFYLSLEPERES